MNEKLKPRCWGKETHGGVAKMNGLSVLQHGAIVGVRGRGRQSPIRCQDWSSLSKTLIKGLNITVSNTLASGHLLFSLHKKMTVHKLPGWQYRFFVNYLSRSPHGASGCL